MIIASSLLEQTARARDVSRDGANLLRGQQARERRHAAAAVVDHLCDQVGILDLIERRAAAMPSQAVLAVARDASRREYLLARRHERVGRGWFAPAGSGGGPGRRCVRGPRRGAILAFALGRRRQRAVEAEEPHAVAPRRADQQVAGRQRADVLLAVTLERRR